MAMPKVVFVDDDKFYAYTWIEALRERYSVDHFSAADKARNNIPLTPKIQCIVLDVMMPTPMGVAEDETADGLETGLWLLRELRDFLQEGLIPVIVLTNRASEVIRQKIVEMNFPDDLVEVRFKLDVSSKRLPEIVRDKITRWNNGTTT